MQSGKFGAVEALSRGLNWLTYISLPMWLSPQSYGEFSFVLAIVLMFSAMGMCGQDRFVLRFVNLQQNNTHLFYLSCILAAVSACLFVGILWGMVSALEFTSFSDDYFYLVALWVLLQCLYLLLVSYCRAMAEARAFIFVRLVYSGAKLLLLSGVAYKTQSVETLVLAECFLLVAIIASVNTLFETRKSFKYDAQDLMRALLFGAPLVVHVMSGVMIGHIDKLMIGEMVGSEELGTFAFLNSLAGGVFFVFAVINIVYEAKVYQYGVGDKADALLSKMSNLGMLVSALILIAVNLLLPIGLPLIGKEGYWDANVMILLSVAYFIYPLYLQSNVRFMLMSDTKLIPVLSGTAALVNVVANLILIPQIGIQGAAVSTLVSYIVLVISSQFVSRRRYSVA